MATDKGQIKATTAQEMAQARPMTQEEAANVAYASVMLNQEIETARIKLESAKSVLQSAQEERDEIQHTYKLDSVIGLVLAIATIIGVFKLTFSGSSNSVAQYGPFGAFMITLFMGAVFGAVLYFTPFGMSWVNSLRRRSGYLVVFAWWWFAAILIVWYLILVVAMLAGPFCWFSMHKKLKEADRRVAKHEKSVASRRAKFESYGLQDA